MDEHAERIVAAARGYLGVRFRHRGRGRHEGVDCGGAVICPAREVGSLPWAWDFMDYAAGVEGGAWRDLPAAGWPGATEVTLRDVWPGDLAMSAYPGTEVPWHVGILARDSVGGWTLIHMNPARGMRVVEEPLAPLVAGRSTWYYRLARPAGV